jgi:predicted PurR-regulated permease PerM
VPETPPPWLVRLPLVGEAIATTWAQGTSLGLRDLVPKLMPYADDATRWFVGEVGSFGVLLFQFLLTVVIAAVMYSSGEFAATLVRKTARRIGGERAVGAVDLAGGAIRGVALGVGVTALVQSLLGGIGVAVAGVPGAGLLAAVMFMLCIAQIGPFPVLLPAVIWVFWSGDTTWGVVLAIWSVLVGTLDNVLRPVLIRMGADLPLLLIFAGVIGGLLSFGLVGIFVGPVILAVAYTLLVAWVDDAERPAPDWRD